MKLIDKLNRSYLAYSFAGMLIAGILIYFSISFVVSRQLDEKLANVALQIENKLEMGGQVDYLSEFINVQKIQDKTPGQVYADTTIYNKLEEENEIYRQLTRITKIHHQSYQITVRESKIEAEDLVGTLAIVIFITLLLLTGSLVIINRKVASKVWAPFYQNLQTIRQFSIKEHSPVKLKETGTLEFDELNQVLFQLTQKIANDYHSLKQFSEDASHEIQTPLAIMTAKLEALVNDSELNEAQSESVRSVFSAVRRLSRLNQGLVLLTKIENNQFVETEPLSINLLIKEKLQDFQELMGLKGIQYELKTKAELMLEADPVLADILVNNLLSNSLNHNLPKGQIQITISKDQLEICNSGEQPIQNPDRLFSRFYKENGSSKSVGLGLAIVNKICEVQGWKINYQFSEKMHRFQIQFRPKMQL